MTIAYQEPKPWIEVDQETGVLNPASYAAIAVWGITELAAETMVEADVAITRTNLLAFSETLAHITDEVQRSLRHDQSVTRQEGSHTRSRGAVRTALRITPVPFGGTTEAWDEWVKKMIRRSLQMSRVAIQLWASQLNREENPPTSEAPFQPWLELAAESERPAAKSA